MDLKDYINEADGLVKKWGETLMSEDAPAITDSYRLAETAKMLENQEQFDRGMINEDAGYNVAGNINTPNPVLISMVRRAAPVLMAYDLAGVQTMTQRTGLVFCMHAHYVDENEPGNKGREALVDEPDTGFTGVYPDDSGDPVVAGSGKASVLESDPFASLYGVGTGKSTAAGEGDIDDEMMFSIDSVSVEAKTRNLRGSYTVELQHDMRASHGLDAEAELSNIMSMELLRDLNREFVRKLYIVGKLGAEDTSITPAGYYDVQAEADGRWAVEKWKNLLFQIDLEANRIGRDIKYRGLGNKIVASPDIISAMFQAGNLDTGGSTNLNREMGKMDFTKGTYVGRLNGRYDVYVDPFTMDANVVLVGYKGEHAWDAGMYFCPYVPFQMQRAVNDRSGQPRIFYRTRNGMVSNPFVVDGDGNRDGMNMAPLLNPYFRKFKVQNLNGSGS